MRQFRDYCQHSVRLFDEVAKQISRHLALEKIIEIRTFFFSKFFIGSAQLDDGEWYEILSNYGH